MTRYLLRIILALGLVACGAANDETETKTVPHSLALDDATKLPECTAEAEGWLVYLKAETKFMACSSGTWEEVVIKTEATVDEPSNAPADAAPPAQKTKLKKGMTKTEAQKAVGAPGSVDSYESFTVWNYSGEICGDIICQLEFTPEGQLDKVTGVKPDYIDVTTF